jgi:iron complex outermembrane receptor protein
VELETTWQATKSLSFLFDYSYLDAYAKSGAIVDPADPDATGPGASPIACSNTATSLGPTPCTADIFTGGMQHYQNLAGNRLPNSPRNKIALNVNYSLFFTAGTFNVSGSYIWRDTQEGTLLTRSYNTAPAWDQFDARLTWTATGGRYKVILYGKNLFNTIGYDAGAYGTRYAGYNATAAGITTNVEAQGIGSTYSVTPPRTYGIEIDYKFF